MIYSWYKFRKKDKELKKLRFVYYFACMALLLTIPAFAYVDPTAATFVISGVAAVAIAAGAVISSVVRKARKKAQEVLHIDENAGKTVEEDIVVFDEADKPAEEGKPAE